MKGLLSNKGFLVELIDFFKKVEIFALTDSNYGTLFEIPGFDFVSKPRQNSSGGEEGGLNIFTRSLNLEETIWSWKGQDWGNCCLNNAQES